MMKKKNFDCVEMKNRIQEKLAERRKGLSDLEIEIQTRKELETSKSPIAKFWRKALNKRKFDQNPLLEHIANK